MEQVRPAAVAGLFYPGDARELKRAVEGYLAVAEGSGEHALPQAPRALIAPHAGYIYSGPVAGAAYAMLAPGAKDIRRVILVGPAHREAFPGIALPRAAAFETPLGVVPVDDAARERLRAHPGVAVLDRPHRLEHSLEVQLPFLQCLLGRFAIVPLLVGATDMDEVAAAIAAFEDGRETVIVVSSYLSHYHDYDTARRMDAATARAIEALRPGAIGPDQACGRLAIQGLLERARARGLAATTIDLRNSGDTAGPRDRVVGYGAWAFA